MKDNVPVFHYMTNFGINQSFKFAIRHCEEDYVITIDIDLGYSPDYLRKLMAKN